jgi:hypothetical protein
MAFGGFHADKRRFIVSDQTIPLKQVVDGFSYNASLKYLPNRFFPNALAQLDILRRAANYRPRWWAIPDTPNTVQPYDTFYMQCEVADGSYLWGYNFCVLAAEGPSDGPEISEPTDLPKIMAPVSVAPTDLCIQVVDSCTGIPLFQDYANGGAMTINGDSRMYPILLTQPRLILEPGLVNVSIANRTANTIVCQLLLHFAEPCQTICEEERQNEWARRALTGGAQNATI